MKTIEAIEKRRKKRADEKRRRRALLCVMSLIFLCLCAGAAYLIYERFPGGNEHLAADYEAENYNRSLYEGDLFAKDLCVATGDVSQENTQAPFAEALFNVDGAETDYAFNIYQKRYPASITKILTALLAIENGDLSETVTVQRGAEDFAPDESVAGIKKGDQMTLEALLYGLLLHSGNDCAESIAYHIAGGIDEFADMMNERAAQLCATGTHFTNPSGLHDENHYTTAYDVYLMFNECIKNDEFVKIISTDSYQADITGADGTKRQITWTPSHYYAQGKAEKPSNAEIVGGKTGTTKAAGNCLVLMNRSLDGKPYISIVMGDATKEYLHHDMSALISKIPKSE